MSLSWGLDGIAESAAYEAPPASPAAPSSSLLSAPILGKSTGTGGGYGGKLVPLRLVRESDALCLGYVGATRSKICLIENCGVQAHQHLKFSYEGVADALIFIKAGSAHTVWASPCIDVAVFGSAWDRYRDETRTTTSWQVLLNAFQAAPHMSDDEAINIGDATKAADVMFTPHKRRRLASVLASPSESEVSFEDVTFVPLMTDPGPNDEISVASVLAQWKTVGSTLELLHAMASSAKRGNKDLDDLLSQSVTLLEAKLGGLRTVVGSRPAEMGTQTLFGELAQHAVELASVDKSLSLLVGRMRATDEAAKNQQKDLKDEIFAELSGALRPLQRLFGELSSTMSTPGDKLHREIAGIKSSITALEARNGYGPSPGYGPPPAGGPGFAASVNTPSPLAWGLGSAGMGAAPSVQSAAPPPLHPAIDVPALARRIKLLEQQMDSQSVKVGMQTFSSRLDADAWMKLNCPLTGSYTYFVDFHSLMALAHGAGGTMGEILKVEEARAKLNFTTPEEAMIMTSFHMEIPSFFGRASSQATSMSSKVLPGLQSFESWDMGDGDRGLRYDLNHRVEERVDSWLTSCEASLPPGAHLVAQSMLIAATNFVSFVANWITQFFNDCKNKGADPDETWKHISHTIRELCAILHNARKAGRGPFLSAPERASGVFWGQLQAHREMQVITKRGLMGDPRLSHILNLHLRDNAVMKSEHKAMADAVRVLQREIKLLKATKAGKQGGAAAGTGDGDQY